MIQPIVYALVAGLVLGSASGYKLRSLIADSEHASLLENKMETLQKEKTKNLALSKKLEIAKSKSRVVYKTSVKRIPQDVTEIQKKDSSCNLTIATKRVFNNLIRDTANASTKLPQ